MDFQKQRIPLLVFSFLLLTQTLSWAQSRNLTVAVLVNSQNTGGYNPSSNTPGEFQRFAERYLEHLQVPYELFDVATAAPPIDLNSRQLIIAGHSRLLMPVSWRNAIATAVNAGTGFVNLDSDSAIGNESHIQAIFGATGSAAGTAATQIVIPPAVAPNGATPHYIAALQKKYDDPSGSLVYPFHAAADGVVRSATSTVLTNATGTVIARLGNDPLLLAKTYGTGRAVHFGTLDYLHADRFGFLMGVDDLFWRSLVWAARKPFVLRGYPRLWAVQMDDTRVSWSSRVGDMYNPALTGSASGDGTGGPWKVTGYLYTDNLPAGSSQRTSAIADINAGKLEVAPHTFIGDVNCGNLYWNTCSGALTDQQWVSNMSLLDAWKQGNGGADAIPSLSRSLVAHYWDISDNTGYDLWNHYGFRYITSIQKSGFQSTLNYNGAERLPVRPFWLYEMPPKIVADPNTPTENYPLFFADNFTVRSRAGLPAQTFFLFATQYLDFAKYSRVDFSWPNASATPVPTVASSVAQLQQYTWRHWSGLGPVQVFTHDAANYENSSVSDRQAVIGQSSSWLNANGVRHLFMDDLGDYIYARTKSTLTRATFDGTQISYTFTGAAANADGTLIPTKMLLFGADNEGLWQTVPGFNNGLQIALALPGPPTLSGISPTAGQQAQTLNITLTGADFISGATCSFGTGITVNSCAFTSSSQMTANITIAGAATTGTRSVTVTNPDGQSTTLPNAFTVNATPGLQHIDFNYANRASLLNAGWSFLATTGAGGSRNTEQTGTLAVSYDQVVHPGTLRVPLGVGENWQNLNNSQNTLFYIPPSDWTSFRVKLAAFNPTANYQQVGLQAYQDDDNYVDTNRAFVNSPRIEMFREVGQSTTYISTAALSNTGNLILRMDRSANSYSGFYSTDGGTTWVSLGSTTVALNNPKLAIMAGANEAATTPVVDLAWVEILRPGPIPAPGISTVSPNAGTQGQTVAVTISGSNFQTGAVCSFGSGITVNSCAMNTSSQMTANITIAASASTGARSVTVTNPDGQIGTLTNAFTVNVNVTPLAVISVSPASGASGVSTTTSVTATFNQALDPATVNSSTFRLLNSTNSPVPASVTYNASTSTATLTPSSALTASSSYQAVITGGANGVKDSSGNPMSSTFSWLFTTAQPVNCPCSIWTSSTTPSIVDSGDAAAVELGVKFRSDVDGYITGLRFYKSSANTGTHIGHLWNSSGTMLSSATFSGETASGWQQVTFSPAVAITAGTTYVASYFAPNGHYSRNPSYFASAGVDNIPLHLLQDGLDGGNGVFVYGTGTTSPTSTFQSTNYWVDIVFNTTLGSPSGPTVVSTSPASGASGVSVSTSVSAVFSQALNPATVTSSTFRLLDSSSNPVAASVTYNSTTLTATLTPASTLIPASSYTAVLTGGSTGIKDSSGNPMSSDKSWLFTTAQSVNCPCSIWTSSTTPSIVDSGDAAAVELGVKFRSDVDGYITGLRFYKSSVNTGTHVGNLWSIGGSLLATATFNGETTSGWQQVTFSPAVAITAGTTYVASYFAPNGHYSLTLGYFSTTGADNAPLHFLQDGVNGGNGVYVYGTTTAFPNSTYQSSNYWVDVVFNTTATQAAALSSLSVSPTTVQGGSSSTGTATLTAAAPAGGATVVLSSSDPAASVPASVTVAAGATTATFTVSTSTVSSSTAVTITGSYQGQQTATLTVTPAASVSTLTLNPTSVLAGATATATVTLSSPAPPTTGAVIALSSDNTSAATVPATITIPAGLTTGSFTVTTNTVPSPTSATISASYNGVKTAVLTINTAAGISALSLTPTSVVSGANATGSVTLTSAAPAGGALVALSSADTTVASVPATVTVAAGATSATFTVSTSGVSSSSTIAISASYSGTRSANLTVTPAVLLSIGRNPATVVGGASSTGTVTLNGAAPNGGAAVALSTTNTAATIPATVTIAAGQTTVTFTITTVPVSNTTSGTISGTYNGVVRTSATFTVNPPALSSIGLNPRTLIGGAQSIGTVTLNGATAAAETVALTTTNTAANVPVNVIIPAGASTATFAVTTVPVSATATGTVSGTYRGSTRTSATLTVNPPALTSLALTPTSVVGGSQSTGTVTLTGVAAANTNIALSSNRAAVVVPSSVLVAAGTQSVSFVINTAPVAANTNASISATYNSVTRSATLTVLAPQLAALTLSPPSVPVGTPSTGTVTLTGPAPPAGTSVSLSSSNRLVATVPSSVLVPADQTSATFLVRSLLIGTATINGTRGVTRSATLTVGP